MRLEEDAVFIFLPPSSHSSLEVEFNMIIPLAGKTACRTYDSHSYICKFMNADVCVS